MIFQMTKMHSVLLTLCIALLGKAIAQSPLNFQPSTEATLDVRCGSEFVTPEPS